MKSLRVKGKLQELPQTLCFCALTAQKHLFNYWAANDKTTFKGA